MDDLVLNAIRHIRNISKKKSCIQKFTANNIDLPSVESTCTEIIANGIIDKDLRTLILTNCENGAILDFVTSDECNHETPQRAPIQSHINIPVIETTPVITSQKTPTLPRNSDKLGEPSKLIVSCLTSIRR